MDHVHLSVAIPPKISISSFIGYLKGKSTLMIYDRYPELQSEWDKAFWSRVIISHHLKWWLLTKKMEVYLDNLRDKNISKPL